MASSDRVTVQVGDNYVFMWDIRIPPTRNIVGVHFGGPVIVPPGEELTITFKSERGFAVQKIELEAWESA